MAAPDPTGEDRTLATLTERADRALGATLDTALAMDDLRWPAPHDEGSPR